VQRVAVAHVGAPVVDNVGQRRRAFDAIDDRDRVTIGDRARDDVATRKPAPPVTAMYTSVSSRRSCCE
jgi:hypothetical protein